MLQFEFMNLVTANAIQIDRLTEELEELSKSGSVGITDKQAKNIEANTSYLEEHSIAMNNLGTPAEEET